MAQTKKKRQTKHRGNAAGVVEVRGRTTRPPSPEQRKREAKALARETRLSRPPSWKVALRNAGFVAVAMFALLLITQHRRDSAQAAAILAVIAFVVYAPGGYYMEKFMWKRRMNSAAAGSTGVKRGR